LPSDAEAAAIAAPSDADAVASTLDAGAESAAATLDAGAVASTLEAEGGTAPPAAAGADEVVASRSDVGAAASALNAEAEGSAAAVSDAATSSFDAKAEAASPSDAEHEAIESAPASSTAVAATPVPELEGLDGQPVATSVAAVELAATSGVDSAVSTSNSGATDASAATVGPAGPAAVEGEATRGSEASTVALASTPAAPIHESTSVSDSTFGAGEAVAEPGAAASTAGVGEDVGAPSFGAAEDVAASTTGAGGDVAPSTSAAAEDIAASVGVDHVVTAEPVTGATLSAGEDSTSAAAEDIAASAGAASEFAVASTIGAGENVSADTVGAVEDAAAAGEDVAASTFGVDENVSADVGAAEELAVTASATPSAAESGADSTSTIDDRAVPSGGDTWSEERDHASAAAEAADAFSSADGSRASDAREPSTSDAAADRLVRPVGEPSLTADVVAPSAGATSSPAPAATGPTSSRGSEANPASSGTDDEAAKFDATSSVADRAGGADLVGASSPATGGSSDVGSGASAEHDSAETLDEPASEIAVASPSTPADTEDAESPAAPATLPTFELDAASPSEAEPALATARVDVGSVAAGAMQAPPDESGSTAAPDAGAANPPARAVPDAAAQEPHVTLDTIDSPRSPELTAAAAGRHRVASDLRLDGVPGEPFSEDAIGPTAVDLPAFEAPPTPAPTIDDDFMPMEAPVEHSAATPVDGDGDGATQRIAVDLPELAPPDVDVREVSVSEAILDPNKMSLGGAVPEHVIEDEILDAAPPDPDDLGLASPRGSSASALDATVTETGADDPTVAPAGFVDPRAPATLATHAPVGAALVPDENPTHHDAKMPSMRRVRPSSSIAASHTPRAPAAVVVTGVDLGEAAQTVMADAPAPSRAPPSEHPRRPAVERVQGTVRRADAPRLPPEDEVSTTVVAVDLGGRVVRVGAMESGVLRFFELDGSDFFPSTIAVLEDGRVVVGTEALEVEASEPHRTASIVELLRGIDDRVLASEVARRAVARDQSGAVVATLSERTIPLAELLLTFFQPFAAALNHRIGEGRTKVMVSVPHELSDRARGTLTDALKSAGLVVASLVPEPVAMLRPYQLALQGLETVLTVDLGATHLGVALARRGREGFYVAESTWHPSISALALDRAIADLVLAEAERPATSLDPASYLRLMQSIRMARVDLRRDATIEVEVPAPDRAAGPRYDVVRLPRSRVYQATQAVSDQVIVAAGQVLGSAGIHPKTVGALIVAGGGGSFPPVVGALTTMAGKEPLHTIPPADLLLHGLADACASGSKSGRRTVLDTLSTSIGISLPGGRFKVLVPAATKLPTSVSRNHPSTRSDQTSVELTFYQGAGDTVSGAVHLGTLAVSELPKGPRGEVVVDVDIYVDREAVMTVTMAERMSGKKKRLTASTQQTPTERRSALAAKQSIEDLSGPGEQVGKKGFFGRLFGR